MGEHVEDRDLALSSESRAIPIFLLTTLLISSGCYFLIIKSGLMGGGWDNTFIQQFFDPLTIHRSKTGYMAGEFGAALLVISIAMAIYFWRRRDEVEGDSY
jgi:uncharacterized protein